MCRVCEAGKKDDIGLFWLYALTAEDVKMLYECQKRVPKPTNEKEEVSDGK